MKHAVPRRDSGISVLELLLFAAALLALSAFSPYWINLLSTHTDLRQAAETVETSVRHARRISRVYQTDVILRLVINEQGELQNVLLSVPGMQLSPDLLTVEQTSNIPPGIRVVADNNQVYFNRQGQVAMAVRASLVSNQSGVSQDVVIR